MLTINNKFELNQNVYAKRVDNSVICGEVCLIHYSLSNENKTPSLQYTIRLTNGKNARTETFDEGYLFSAANDAFMVPSND